MSDEGDFNHLAWKNTGFNLDDYLKDTVESEEVVLPIPKFEPGHLVSLSGTKIYDNVLLRDVVNNNDIKCKVIKYVNSSPVIVVSVLDRILFIVHPESFGWTAWNEVNIVETSDLNT